MGEFLGKVLMAREICDFVAPHWPQAKVLAVACALGESNGYVGAYNINRDPSTDNETSRDCGLMQISVEAEDIAQMESLMTESKDPPVYEPIVRYNVKRARQLYDAPMIRDGKQDKRRWQPWVAVTTGWAWFPHAWVWKHVDGEPVGPWVPTGRFLLRAVRGVVNWRLLTRQDLSVENAVVEAERLARLHGITNVTWRYSTSKAVYYVLPPIPTVPPPDGRGPRPVPNDGIWTPPR